MLGMGLFVRLLWTDLTSLRIFKRFACAEDGRGYPNDQVIARYSAGLRINVNLQEPPLEM